MPISISAKKKLRQDAKRHRTNRKAKDAVNEAVKKFRSNPAEKLLAKTFSVIDRGRKKHIFHANKAARMKSSLSKLIAKKGKVVAEKAAPAKKAPVKKKTSTKKK